MVKTNYGPFNGDSWEALCQLVFKMKYGHLNYQPMGASPGDYGIEGFTLEEGMAFQCYCPEKNYSTAELYEKQRDKITKDLGKLKKYEKQLASRIGKAQIKQWHFVTPELSKNELHVHARAKEEEAQKWSLSILDPKFQIVLCDAEFFHADINAVRSVNGEAITFDSTIVDIPVFDGPPEEYEANLLRKTELRIPNLANRDWRVATLYDNTQQAFLQYAGLLKSIDNASPTVFYKLMQIIGEFEIAVIELKVTWTETPEQLVNKVREGLAEKIKRQLSPNITETQADKIARHVVASWLAVCELDFE